MLYRNRAKRQEFRAAQIGYRDAYRAARIAYKCRGAAEKYK